jgi:hypothetical protein
VDDESNALAPTRGSLAKYPTSRLSPRFELVDTALEIAQADEALASVTNARLELVAEQIRGLQEKARQILDEARSSAELHRARCDFVRRPGHVYHLYARETGERYFSLLSEADWGPRVPHRFVGSYRLESDMRWTRLGEERTERS